MPFYSSNVYQLNAESKKKIPPRKARVNKFSGFTANPWDAAYQSGLAMFGGLIPNR